jgi:hypothetical protein
MKNRNKISKILSLYRGFSPRTEVVYIELLRNMGGERRLKVAFELYDMAVNLCKHNIIEKNPEITEGDLKKKILERLKNKYK